MLSRNSCNLDEATKWKSCTLICVYKFRADQSISAAKIAGMQGDFCRPKIHRSINDLDLATHVKS